MCAADIIHTVCLKIFVLFPNSNASFFQLCNFLFCFAKLLSLVAAMQKQKELLVAVIIKSTVDKIMQMLSKDKIIYQCSFHPTSATLVL